MGGLKTSRAQLREEFDEGGQLSRLNTFSMP